MTQAMLEHVNVTVSDASRTAGMLCNLFDWHIRWEGDGMNGLGRTVHVGIDDCYLALYSPHKTTGPGSDSHNSRGGLNHVGVVVDDLDAAEKRVEAAGFTPKNHADYEPGHRFYFNDSDGIEFEVVSYTK